jgi:nitric oxide reductase NorE protein
LGFAIWNTLFLVTSGYFVAMAVNFLKEKNRNSSRKYLLVGIFFGLAFLILKAFEYSEKISQGYTSSYNEFFTFYWFLTFFHFMHVFFVTGILAFLFFKIKKESDSEVYALEVGGALWHMCDLIWILLFPTLFFIR